MEDERKSERTEAGDKDELSLKKSSMWVDESELKKKIREAIVDTMPPLSLM